MFKKLIFIIPLAFAMLLPLPAYADTLDDVITEAIDEPTDTPTPASTISETPAPLGEQKEQNEQKEPESLSNSDQNSENIVTENTRVDSPDQVASLDGITSNPIISGIKDRLEEVVDPETWPLILSAVALVLTIILILVINIVAHKKARKATAEANRQELENGLRDL